MAKKRRRLLWWAVAGAVLLQFFVFSRFWLTLAGGFLIYQDALRPADAILVLGGGREERVAQGLELYRRSYGKKLLFTGEYEETLLARSHWADNARKIAVAGGLPPAKAVAIYGSESTYDDAVLSLKACRKSGIASLIVVSEPYHTRRAHYTFRKVFRGSGITVMVYPVQESWFKKDTWWRSEKGLLAANSEYVKMAYYLLKGYLR